jgi:hypothetical protein
MLRNRVVTQTNSALIASCSGALSSAGAPELPGGPPLAGGTSAPSRRFQKARDYLPARRPSLFYLPHDPRPEP